MVVQDSDRHAGLSLRIVLSFIKRPKWHCRDNPLWLSRIRTSTGPRAFGHAHGIAVDIGQRLIDLVLGGKICEVGGVVEGNDGGIALRIELQMVDGGGAAREQGLAFIFGHVAMIACKHATIGRLCVTHAIC